MVRVWLADDPRGLVPEPARVALADDVAATVVTELNPELTVQVRVRDGFDDDGLAQFTWSDVVTGRAAMWEQREEKDAQSGMTLVKASAVLLYDGATQVSETAQVFVTDGDTYRVTKVAQFLDRLEFELDRVHGG